MNDITRLAVNLNPTRVQGKKTEQPRRGDKSSKSDFYPKRRAILNIIPDSEELARLIDRALNALSQGVFWDRGSIVNIVL